MEMPSNNLWVGNLKPEVTESELISLFHRYGNVDAVTSFSERSFAFVRLRNLNDAKAAKEALQGTVVCGNPLKIRFAKPANPCKSLWIAGIDQSVSKEELEKQFKRFGKIQELKFIKDHSTAYVEFSRVEDATEALKNMNGKTVGGRHIRLDYLRSQPAKREHGLEYQEMGKGPYSRSINHPDTRVMPQDLPRGYPEILHAGSKRQNPFQLPTGRRGEQPSKVLWIRHPTSVHVDEDMLHNAMILFGEIDVIKTFNDRNYSFVKFRSVEEAQRAKEGLQGKLLNDHRITIEYHCSDFAPGRDLFRYHTPIRGAQPDMYPNENPLQPAFVGISGHNRPMLESNIPGHLPPKNHVSPVGFGQRNSSDHLWHGIIAKAGKPICRARCVPIGEGIESDFPEVINYTARAGLDKLTEHYANAVGFSVVYFLPDTEEDFAVYTEFMRYLGLKTRAGVAKFDDGTTLFLVPPSDFLSKVLNVLGPERLYGVVLKFAQRIPSGTSLQREARQPQYMDVPQITSYQATYDAMPPVGSVPQMDRSWIPRKNLRLPSETVDFVTNMNTVPDHTGAITIAGLL